MSETQAAAFRFEKYRIPEFSYTNSNKNKTTLSLDITPRGVYNKGNFDVEINVKAFDSENPEVLILTLKCIATFKFEDETPLASIPAYFYKNSIAIVFPYLRAFVSTLTLQANTGLIQLGLLNLSGLEKELLDNTTEEVL
jgi:preprotein translocase subunit SecB